MRKRRIAILLGAAVIASTLTGCSGKAPAGTQAVSENNKETDPKAQAEAEGKPEAEAQSGETVVIKFGHNYSASSGRNCRTVDGRPAGRKIRRKDCAGDLPVRAAGNI